MNDEKYTLFCGSTFYPSGGWDDFKGHFKTIEDAKLWLQKNEPDANYKWAHIVEKGKIIWKAKTNDNYMNDTVVYEWKKLDE